MIPSTRGPYRSPIDEALIPPAIIRPARSRALPRLLSVVRVELYEWSWIFDLNEVRECTLLKKLVDGGAKVLPHPMEPARLAGRTPTRLFSFRVKGGVIADDLKGVTLNRVQDVFEGYLGGWALKLISTLRATHALNHLAFAESLEDLLCIGEVYALALSYLRRSDSEFSVIFGEVDGAQDAALSPFRDSHTSYHSKQRIVVADS